MVSLLDAFQLNASRCSQDSKPVSSSDHRSQGFATAGMVNCSMRMLHRQCKYDNLPIQQSDRVSKMLSAHQGGNVVHSAEPCQSNFVKRGQTRSVKRMNKGIVRAKSRYGSAPVSCRAWCV